MTLLRILCLLISTKTAGQIGRLIVEANFNKDSNFNLLSLHP